MTDTNENQLSQPKTEQETEGLPTQLPEMTEVDILSNKIIELENGLNQYKDQLLRKAAEFENYKKRTDNDYAAIIRFSNEELIMKLLPVLDDFERSMKVLRKPGDETETSKSVSAFIKGMELIYNKFKTIVEKEGVKHFEVIGKPFDPQMHDALLQIPRHDVPPHTVLEEVEKGYMLSGKVLRHAKVVVSTDSRNDSDSTTTFENGDAN